MPTLDPIVVNPPKEKKTYTFSDNDIKDISREVAQQEIAKIPTPASGTKLYKHSIANITSAPFVFISLSNTPVVGTDTYAQLQAKVLFFPFKSNYHVLIIGVYNGPSGSNIAGSSSSVQYFDNTGTYKQDTYSVTSITDTVTEL